MKKRIWQICQGEDQIKSIEAIIWRLVESQQKAATRKLVDSLGEQIILEEMIEETKPILPDHYFDLHPLLYTPFRYPPLPYGSRFGHQFEPAIWYGSLELTTAMAEKAFYQFHFLRGSKAEFGLISVPLTAFSVNIKTRSGIDLSKGLFAKYTNAISSPISYDVSQALGSDMRDANIQAFLYQSARDLNKNVNAGIFSLSAFSHRTPNKNSMQSWLCTVDNNVIEFSRTSAIDAAVYCFLQRDFMIDGKLPYPAS